MSFMRNIFGPSREEVWTSFCVDIGGEYINGGFWKPDKVKVKMGELTFILDTFNRSTGKTNVTYTRIRVPYINSDDFIFKIYPAGFFSELGKVFGMQDIIINHEEIDNLYIFKGNNVEKVRELMSNEEIRQLLLANPGLKIEVRKSDGIFGYGLPEGVTELYFEERGVIKDSDWLKTLYDFYYQIIYQLNRMGSAINEDPDVKL